MRHRLLLTLLVLSLSTAFGAEAEKNTVLSKCTPDYVPIMLKTKDGKTYHAMIKKVDREKLHGAKGLSADTSFECPDIACQQDHF